MSSLADTIASLEDELADRREAHEYFKVHPWGTYDPENDPNLDRIEEIEKALNLLKED